MSALAVDLIRQAEAAGITLAVREDAGASRLDYEAPETPEADRLLADLAASRQAVIEALLIRRGDAVARRLIAQGVDPDLADELSERVAIETEFLSPLLAGARLVAARLVTPEDG